MAYNDTPQEFIDSLTKENCPPRWIEEAKKFKNNLDAAPEDQRRVYRHILQNILSAETSEEFKTTSSRRQPKVEPIEESEDDYVEENGEEIEEEIVVEEEEE